ncbi:guanine nucleotide exchange factor [Anaeramoeba flamelloides]|uniref:Guanine nucleotide exchange factor n=1 Tax=Anaeramoeba flamelloides TaxID=1746091 RepID=A0ABQ8YA58_9EUKA|nr:guanine nucleotide exchange factor [Anaeramoeba flamelloides]
MSSILENNKQPQDIKQTFEKGQIPKEKEKEKQQEKEYDPNSLEFLFQKPLHSFNDQLMKRELTENKTKIGLIGMTKKNELEIRQCTFDVLFDKLVYEPKISIKIYKRLLLVYPTFTTKKQFFGALVRRFHYVPETEESILKNAIETEYRYLKGNSNKKRVIQLLEVWIDYQREDFREDQEWTKSVVVPFVKEHVLPTNQKVGKRIILIVIKNKYQEESARINKYKSEVPSTGYPVCQVPKEVHKLQLGDLSAIEIARQITLMDCQQFTRIPIREFIACEWDNPKQLDLVGYSLNQYISQFHNWINLIVSSVMANNKPDLRAHMIDLWCNVGLELLKIRNFNALFATVAGLQSHPIARLDDTWKLVGNETKRILSKLLRATSKQNCYKKYRELIKDGNLPTLPFLDLLNYQISLIKYKKSDFIQNNTTNIVINNNGKQNGLINLRKFIKMGKIIEKILHFQTSVYHFYKLIEVRRIFKSVPILNEEEQMERSKKIEKQSDMFSNQFLFRYSQPANKKPNNNSTTNNLNKYDGDRACWDIKLRQPIVKSNLILRDTLKENGNFIKQFEQIDPGNLLVEYHLKNSTDNNNNNKNNKDDENNGSNHKSNTKMVIIGGTLKALVEHLTPIRSSNTSFLQTFLLTYRDFTDSVKFLEMLKERYLIKPPTEFNEKQCGNFNELVAKPIKLRIITVLHTWLKFHFHDFTKNPFLIQCLEEFVENIILKDVDMKKSGLMVKAILKKMLNNPQKYDYRQSKQYSTSFNTEIPKPILPKDLNNLSLLEIDNVEFARQLTLIEFDLYCKIEPKECLKQAWTKTKKETLAPNIIKMTQFFNSLSNWIATEMVSIENVKVRAQLMTKLIKLAYQCKKIGNFNSIQEISAGLNISSVFRLKKTKELLSNKSKQIWKHTAEIVHRRNNFRLMREMISKIDPPALPYVGMYLTDLVFVDEGNPDTILSMNRAELINFDKFRRTSEIIKQIQQFQQTPYYFKEVPQIRDWILRNTNKIYNTKDIYKQSLIIEPRESKN